VKETTRVALSCILLFLVVGLAVAATVARQFFRGCRASPRNACIANLWQIEGAKNTWMLEYRKTTNDIPTDSDLFGTNRYIKTKPNCGLGGTYTLGPAGERPKCSIADHNVWFPKERTPKK
jgi:hypothetical protein